MSSITSSAMASIKKRPRQVPPIEEPASSSKRPRTICTTSMTMVMDHQHHPHPQQQHVVEIIPPSVSFSSLPPRKYTAPYSHISSEEASQIWYSRAELSALRLQARIYLFSVVDKPHRTGNRNEEDSSTTTEEEDEESTTRGYEQYIDMAARGRKDLARRAILLAHSKYQLPPEKLAVIAQRVAERAIHDAFMLACQDYCNVHCHLQPHEEEERANHHHKGSTITPQQRSILKRTTVSLSSCHDYLSPPPAASNKAVTIHLPQTPLPSLTNRRVSMEASH